jgi:spore coat protein A, manganese oxidase
LNLALFVVDPTTKQITSQEIPFYQIGAEQGFLPNVVRIRTGEQTVLTPGGGEQSIPTHPNRALLMAPAERADVIVDFSGLEGKTVRMINTGPDAPFGGFNGFTPADPSTTGQVMQFVVTSALTGAYGSTDGKTTSPANLQLKAEGSLGASVVTRQVSLNEKSSSVVCVAVDPVTGDFTIPVVPVTPTVSPEPSNTFVDRCIAAGGAPFGPTAALLGTVSVNSLGQLLGNPLLWTDETGASQPLIVKLKSGATMTVNVTETPKRGDTETWQIANFTVDAHPIHLHLVKFEVVSRTLLDGVTPSPNGSLPPTEEGFKDTVIAFPGEITTVKAKFDIAGLYVWHCHIVEHEDNEMMRPYVVTDVFQPPHKHDYKDRDRHDHKMKHEYRWADKYKVKK